MHNFMVGKLGFKVKTLTALVTFMGFVQVSIHVFLQGAWQVEKLVTYSTHKRFMLLLVMLVQLLCTAFPFVAPCTFVGVTRPSLSFYAVFHYYQVSFTRRSRW